MRNAIVALGAAVILTMLAPAAPAQPAPVSPDKSAPAVTPEAVQRYIAGHPNIFAERKIFSIDQVRISSSVSPELAAQLQPLKTMDQVVVLLVANNIQFDRINNRLDAVGSDPAMIEQILKLSPDDMFAVPSGQMLLINKVTGVQIVPFTGDAATQYAARMLSRDAAPPAAK